MSLSSKLSLVLGAVALCAGSSLASAHSIQVFSIPTTAPAGGGNTNYTYQIVVTADNEVRTGDFFTLVDMTGYVSVASIPTGWTLFNSAGIAVTPAGASGNLGPLTLVTTLAGQVGVLDSTSIPDLTFEYIGSSTLGGATTNTSLGNFVITSTKSLFNLSGSTIVGSDHQTGSGLAGQNGDPYITPGDTGLPVPLPAAAWGGMSLLGALGAGKVLRRRK